MKKITVILSTLVIGLITTIVIIASDLKESKNLAINALNQYGNTKQKFESEKTALNKLITKQDQIILDKNSAIEAGLLAVDELKEQNIKELQAKIRIEQEFKAYKLKAKFDTITEIVYILDTNNVKYLRLPTKFKYADDYIGFNGLVQFDGVLVNEISLKNEFKIFVGYEYEKGIKKYFKQGIPVVKMESSNPYVNVRGMNNVIIDKKKWHDNKLFVFGSGFFLSSLIFMIN